MSKYRRGKERELGSLVDMLAHHYGWTEKLLDTELTTRWAEIVGPNIAAVTKPLGVRFGVLQVEVATPTWRAELAMMAPQVLAKLRKELPKLGIKEIRWL